jgi:hypothetical protein
VLEVVIGLRCELLIQAVQHDRFEIVQGFEFANVPDLVRRELPNDSGTCSADHWDAVQSHPRETVQHLLDLGTPDVPDGPQAFELVQNFDCCHRRTFPEIRGLASSGTLAVSELWQSAIATKDSLSGTVFSELWHSGNMARKGSVSIVPELLCV